jgi:hypothetical protein
MAETGSWPTVGASTVLSAQPVNGRGAVSNLSAGLPRDAVRSRTSPPPAGVDELGRCGAEQVAEVVRVVPHSLHTAEVTGSIPVTPTSHFCRPTPRRPSSHLSSGSLSLVLGHTWGMLASAVAMYCPMTVTTRACMAGVMCHADVPALWSCQVSVPELAIRPGRTRRLRLPA